MEAMQLWQTGRRETSRRGAPQIRQSSGKQVKKRVAAARLAEPTNLNFAELSGNRRFAAWPWAARIRKPELLLLLLKTASAPEKSRRFAGPHRLSIAAACWAMQRDCRSQRAAFFESTPARTQFVRKHRFGAICIREDRSLHIARAEA